MTISSFVPLDRPPRTIGHRAVDVLHLGKTLHDEAADAPRAAPEGVLLAADEQRLARPQAGSNE